jgi:hypothetical protein
VPSSRAPCLWRRATFHYSSTATNRPSFANCFFLESNSGSDLYRAEAWWRVSQSKTGLTVYSFDGQTSPQRLRCGKWYALNAAGKRNLTNAYGILQSQCGLSEQSIPELSETARHQ